MAQGGSHKDGQRGLEIQVQPRCQRQNQDFGRLHARDATDSIVPPWLKVYWQKGHPEVNYDNVDDPTVSKFLYKTSCS